MITQEQAEREANKRFTDPDAIYGFVQCAQWMQDHPDRMRWVRCDAKPPESWANVIYRVINQPNVVFMPSEFHGATNDRKVLFFQGINGDMEIFSSNLEYLYEPKTNE